jgi:predicted amidohydrolase
VADVLARAVGLAATADAAHNRRLVADALAAAARDGVDLVVLPEYSAAFDPRGVGRELAEPLDGPFVASIAGAGGEAVVLAGLVVSGGPEVGARGANTVVAVAGGAVVGTYRKVHLYDAFGQRESDRLEPGDPAAPPLVVPVGGLRVGVLTCYDLRFPEAARRCVDAGADVLAVPAAWASGPHKADHWLTLLRARAIENTCYVVGAPMQGRGVAGVPVVVDPLGVVVAQGDGRRPWADESLSPATVAEVRAANPSLLNRRYAVVPKV